MKTTVAVLAAACLACTPPAPANSEAAGWEAQARNVTIIRDDHGIPHIHGKTDADAVFGLIYAQAEDDFNRVETNYLNGMGRLAEAEGESEIYRDLRMKLFITPDSIKAQFASSPDWLRKLMIAWADGLNFYLARHPDVKPKVITRFEPWMALTFSEGSIGGDIETISLSQLEAFYGKGPKVVAAAETTPRPEPTGSNGIAIAPALSASHHALLLINPHTSFFFRAEVQVSSDEGLNAYGAVTWGQFFVYQGFNEHAGWMHTSSNVDNIDEYAETITQKAGGLSYRYGAEERPVTVTKVVVPYKTGTGMAQKEFTVFRTHHGPVVREADGKWVTVRLMQEPLKALTQSYSRTKSKNYAAFKETMQLHTNSSNNTVFADGEGNIAYFHANFIPKRDARFDWTKPVDGANPATEWQPVLSVDESPGLLNPPTGWLYNTNNAPWSAAGPNSPKKAAFPPYVESGEDQNYRGVHAIRVLSATKDFTVSSLIAAAYDSYLPAFEALIPPLVQAYDRAPSGNPLKAKLAEPIKQLRGWDFRWSVASVPTSLAVYWGEALARARRADAAKAGMSLQQYIVTKATAQDRLDALASAVDSLAADFGKWDTPWGEINRFQRLTGDIVHPFADSGASIPVAFTSSLWGSLAAFEARPHNGTKKRYGTSGNSFVAVVEFGDSVRARAVTAGGESGHPGSPHFNDQATRYSTGDLREVYFYPAQLTGHIERQYHPGEAAP